MGSSNGIEPAERKLIRTPSPPRCTICMETRSADKACIMPCSHEFDLECLRTLLQSVTTTARCPLCRKEITEVRYAFTSEGTYSTHIVAEDGQLLEAEEELPPGMSEWERTRTLELRRLRRKREYATPFLELRTAESAMVEGDNIVFAKRALVFRLIQKETWTTTFMSRNLATETVPATNLSLLEYANIVRTQQPVVVQEIREEINRILEGLKTSGGKVWEGMQLTEPQVFVPQDSRGLAVKTKKEIRVKRMYPILLTSIPEPVNVAIERRIIMEEELPSPADVVVETPGHLRRGLTKEERERRIEMAREEIQGVMETIQFVINEPQGLEAATTGLLERASQLDCESCVDRHRNGDCMLPFVDVADEE